MRRREPVCGCASCAADPLLLTAVGEHRFGLDTLDVDGFAWRWTCGCRLNARGRWQQQSPGAAFHSWRRHAELEVRR